MPLKGEAKKAYQRAYMRDRYALDKAFKERVAMRADRHRLKIALNRVLRAERKALEKPGAVEAWELSLGAQLNRLLREGR